MIELIQNPVKLTLENFEIHSYANIVQFFYLHDNCHLPVVPVQFGAIAVISLQLKMI